MRSTFKLNSNATSELAIDVCVAPPHQFLIEHQNQLLPGWNSVNYLILVLQQSSVSLRQSTIAVATEKNRLRNNFFRIGCAMVFTLQDRGFDSDLFDPRTGYPWLTMPGTVLDDNAVVKAVLNYPVINYNNCSLINHPQWQDRVYPATMVTTAPLNLIELSIEQIVDHSQWYIALG